MATALAIKDWDQLFTISELDRKVKVWRYVPLPIKLAGERFRTLMATKFGRQNFALFVALCECGANLPKRGVLADERGPLTTRGISIRTGIPEAAVKQGIAALSHPDIGWLVSVEIGAASGRHPDSVRTNPTLATLPDHTSPYPQPENTNGTARAPHRFWSEVQPIYDAYPRHRRPAQGVAVKAIAAALEAAVVPNGSKPIDWLLCRVRAYAGSWAATRENGQYCVGMVKFMDGMYAQDDGDWAEPKRGGISNAEIVARSAAKAAKGKP